MGRQISNRIVFMTILLIFTLLPASSFAALNDDEQDLPTTGFEDRNSGEWTTERAAADLFDRQGDVQYATDFSEYEVGSIPNGWSESWNPSNWEIANGTDNQLIQTTGGSTGRWALTWDEIGQIEGDVEVFGLVSADSNDSLFSLPIHVSGESGTETAYYLNANIDIGAVRIARYNEGAFTELIRTDYGMKRDTYYRVLFQREGTTLRGKVWENGTPEPEEWDVVINDSTLSGGYVGVSGASQNTTTRWAYIGVGVGEESAPRAEEDYYPTIPINKSSLQKRVADIENEGLTEGDFIEEDWEIFKTALDTAKEILNDPNATQAEVDEALNNLNDARMNTMNKYIIREIGDRLLPDPFLSVKGEEISTTEDWENIRRPEILELFKEYIYGVAPVDRPDNLTFEVKDVNEDMMGGQATRQQVTISYSGPGGTDSFDLLVFIPNNADGPVPTFLFMNNRGYENMDPDREIIMPFWPAEEIIERGYATAVFQTSEVSEDDSSAAFNSGVHEVFDPEGERAYDAWGTIAAWAWGASLALDYLETESAIDSNKVAVAGHSRGGKAALWAGATDERFDLTISNNSGSTGAAIARGKGGETIENINEGFPHWFNRNYKYFNGLEYELPIDQHLLVSLMAPRLVYVSSASSDSWADPQSEFLSAVHASPVYELYGDGLETDEFPSVNTPLHAGKIGYHVRQGGHDLTSYDWQRFMDFWELHSEEETEPISAAGMITSIEQFDEAGAFENDQVARSLILHLTAVDQYESQEEAEKVVRHMESFILLLDHMEEKEQISGEAYDSLYADTESLIEKWK